MMRLDIRGTAREQQAVDEVQQLVDQAHGIDLAGLHMKVY